MKRKKLEMSIIEDKFDNAWRLVLENDIVFNGDIETMEGHKVFVKCSLPPDKGGFTKILKTPLSMAKYVYQDKESILFIFAIQNIKDKLRDINDIILQLLRAIEEKYSYFDYSRLSTDNQFKYLIIIKKIEEDIFI